MKTNIQYNTSVIKLKSIDLTNTSISKVTAFDYKKLKALAATSDYPQINIYLNKIKEEKKVEVTFTDSLGNDVKETGKLQGKLGGPYNLYFQDKTDNSNITNYYIHNLFVTYNKPKKYLLSYKDSGDPSAKIEYITFLATFDK